MRLIYLFGVRIYAFAIRVASLWNPKAKAWMHGRKDVWSSLRTWQKTEDPVYWFHCASLGEFEQGRPLIEKLKAKEKCQIVITFFSPSGYAIRKQYELADLVIYLPRETPANVKRFLDEVRPIKAFFIKYEFWALYLFQAKARGVKLYSIAAVFRKNQLFFKWYGGYMRRVLATFDRIFVQDATSQKLLDSIKIASVLAGDTRYDRVMENAAKVGNYPAIERFKNTEKVLVIGSSWPEDERVLFNFLQLKEFDWKVIIAPHEITENHLKSIEKGIGLKSVRYSDFDQHTPLDVRCLIIDNIGMLMHLYQYADIAYVGGAFGKGLHNVLEPACFGVPVIFGEKYSKFREATDFVTHQIGFSIGNAIDFRATFTELALVDRKADVIRFMHRRVGATQLILSEIEA